MKLKKGLVQVYTGNGKGKTTAAIGLAVRAAGAGLKVALYQFMKRRCTGELRAIKKIRGIKVMQCGSGCFIKGAPSAKDIELAHRSFARCRRDMISGDHDIIILDEANVAMNIGLIDTKDVLSLISLKPAHTELVLTGRNCPKEIIGRADLVTEMREVKHPYRLGITARPGIEC